MASPAPPPLPALPLETLRVGAVGTDHVFELAGSTAPGSCTPPRARSTATRRSTPARGVLGQGQPPRSLRSVYDEAKRYAEALAFAHRRAHGVDVSLARIFNTYGPRLDPYDGRVVSNFIRQALLGEPLTLYGDGARAQLLLRQ